MSAIEKVSPAPSIAYDVVRLERGAKRYAVTIDGVIVMHQRTKRGAEQTVELMRMTLELLGHEGAYSKMLRDRAVA